MYVFSLENRPGFSLSSAGHQWRSLSTPRRMLRLVDEKDWHMGVHARRIAGLSGLGVLRYVLAQI
eukprot:1377489-Amorphochlora_amoeboformis.AAC.1